MSNLTWHDYQVSPDQRRERIGHPGSVIWMTGLSGSGKSTIADALNKALFDAGNMSHTLDGDNVRHGLCSDLGFTARDRTENIRRVAELAKLFNDVCVITITAFISPLRVDRMKAREIIGSDFIEVFIDTPLELCEQRDPKGLYQKARSGEIPDFTGIDSPYEAPEQPEIHIQTARQSVDESVQQIIQFLSTSGRIR